MDEVPRMRNHAVPPRTGGQSERLQQLRPPSGDHAARAREVVDRIELEIRGGREAGFRTYSVKQNFGPEPSGTWSCAVETASGQFLGERRIVIASP